jgi:flagellar biosynthesis GTPase FlhF
MAHLGRLLGVATYTVDHLDELPALLQRVSRQRLVLIDTVGLSARDERTAGALRALRAASPQMEIAITLAASMQTGRRRGMPRTLPGRRRIELCRHKAG